MDKDEIKALKDMFGSMRIDKEEEGREGQENSPIPEGGAAIGLGVVGMDGLAVLTCAYKGDEIPLAVFLGENEAKLYSLVFEMAMNSDKSDVMFVDGKKPDWL